MFNHSETVNLEKKNIDIFPSKYTTSASSGILNWAKINFQYVSSQKRVWQFKGSGFTDQNSVEIIYTTATPYKIFSDAPPSGIVTSSTLQNSRNAYNVAVLSSSSGGNATTIKIKITLSNSSLQDYEYDIFINDAYDSNSLPTFGGSGSAE